MRALLLFLLLPGAAFGQALSVPSGQPVSLLEVIDKPEDMGGTGISAMRFRFLAPQLKKGPQNEKDMVALCNSVAVPEVGKRLPPGFHSVIVSLSSQPIKLGETAPGLVQVIEAFDIRRGKCEMALPW